MTKVIKLDTTEIPHDELKHLVVSLDELQAANEALGRLKVEVERMEQARTEAYAKYDAVRTRMQRRYSWDNVVAALINISELRFKVGENVWTYQGSDYRPTVGV